MTDNLERKVAYIESIVTDQGNGSSYCSNCKENIDIKKYNEGDYCPGCNYRLKWGGTYSGGGGSDF